MRGQGFDVVDGLGLLSRLRDVATSVRELEFVDTAGERVAAISTRRSRDRELEVSRADLGAALIEAARRQAQLETVSDLPTALARYQTQHRRLPTAHSAQYPSSPTC